MNSVSEVTFIVYMKSCNVLRISQISEAEIFSYIFRGWKKFFGSLAGREGGCAQPRVQSR